MQTPQIVFIIFTAVTSVGVLMQAFVLLSMFFAVKKATSEVHELSDQLKQHLVPTLATTRNLIEDVSPKIKVATSNLVEASGILRSQAEQINKKVNEVADLAQAQVSRVDEMATAVLDGLTQATAAVQHGIASPLKQVSGVLNGLRAGIDVLRKKERPTHVEGDGSNFV
jgi:ABC-type transporter Mla subunit MlaD